VHNNRFAQLLQNSARLLQNAARQFLDLAAGGRRFETADMVTNRHVFYGFLSTA